MSGRRSTYGLSAGGSSKLRSSLGLAGIGPTQTAPTTLRSCKLDEKSRVRDVDRRARIQEVRVLEDVVDVIAQLQRREFPHVDVLRCRRLGPDQARSVDGVATQGSRGKRCRVPGLILHLPLIVVEPFLPWK
jgi:hypothetical protein